MTYPIFELTSAFDRITSGIRPCNSISKNGDRVFIVYNTNINNTNNIKAELFDNNNGRLLTSRTIMGDSEFPNTNSGFASNCFNYFVILDDNGMKTARIRLYDNCLNLRTVKYFKDYYSVGHSFIGGKFSEDSRYITLQYVYSSNSGYEYQKSILKVLKTENLEEVASYKYDGCSPTYSSFFKINKKQYIILPIVHGRYSNTKMDAIPPSLLVILELKKTLGVLNLVYQVELPQIYTYDIKRISPKCIYIMIGTRRINSNNSIFKEDSKSFLTQDNHEYRIYKFISNKLYLICTKSYDVSIEGKFYPNSDIIGLNQINNSCSFIQMMKLDKYLCTNDKSATRGYFSPSNCSFNFSYNGKWLIMTGANTNSNSTVKNIQLYRIN